MADSEATIRSELARFLASNQQGLAARILAIHGGSARALGKRFDELRDRVGDAEDHLEHLAAAVAASAPALFLDHVAWAKVLLISLGIPAEALARSLDATRATLVAALDPEPRSLVVSILDEAAQALPGMPSEAASAIEPATPHAALASRYLGALLAGERHRASSMILDEVAGGTQVGAIYLDVMRSSQHELGRLWQMNLISVAEEHYCTAATQQVMAQLQPWIFAPTRRAGLRVVVAAVEDELHEIGARMVADFFEMAGWDACYLGASVPLAALASTIAARRPDLVAISATMTRHLAGASEIVRRLRARPAIAEIPILVGGYPFDVAADLWRHVGADGGASSPVAAVELGRRLVAERISRERLLS